jgi:hypothetical protein
MDESPVSVYAFAKPFVTMASRKEVNGVSDYYTNYFDPNNEADWYLEVSGIVWGPDDYDVLKSDTEITGGILLGPGIEISPAKSVSIFFQAAFSYTFPITFVSTKSYDATTESYFNEEFPMTKEGFPSVNIQAGITFNF